MRAEEAQRVVSRAKRKSDSKSVESKLNRAEEKLGDSSSEKKRRRTRREDGFREDSRRDESN